MKISITEEQYKSIIEVYQRETDPIAQTIRKCLKDVFSKIPGKWGKLPNPDGNCETDEGVINIYEHQPGVDNWSILNRFDTNKKVRTKLLEWYQNEYPNESINNSNIIKWIESNKESLFNSEKTSELVELNRNTIEKGNRNEETAIEVLRKKWGETAIIQRFCSGDIRDTKKGMDISVKVGDAVFYVQVKPFIKVESFVDRDGDTFFEVTAFYDPKKYSEKNVQVILFVNDSSGDYIAFENKRNQILSKSNTVVNFYEPYLMTNIEFATKYKEYRRKDLGDELFGMGERRLENLLFRKSEIEKLIELEKQKILKNKSEN
jgi:CRISPR/Cas system-associated protein Cas5 (RAMP superfamily)